MPCCFAVLSYDQCRHHSLFKVGCTANCNDFCDLEKRVVLLHCRYLWCCEQCNDRIQDAAENERKNNWAAMFRRIYYEEGPHTLTEPRIENIRRREETKQRHREKTMVAQIEEIQWVGEWTMEYGIVLFQKEFGRPKPDEKKVQERIEQLLELRMWDFIVVKDSLHGIMERHRLRQGLRRPARHLSPPPLFDDGDTTTTDEWSYSSEMDIDEEPKEMTELEWTTPRSMMDVSPETEPTTASNSPEVEGRQEEHETVDDIG